MQERSLAAITWRHATIYAGIVAVAEELRIPPQQVGNYISGLRQRGHTIGGHGGKYHLAEGSPLRVEETPEGLHLAAASPRRGGRIIELV